MLERLTQIFDENITQPEDRYSALLDLALSTNGNLEEAERHLIYSESSFIDDQEDLARALERPNLIQPEVMEFTNGAFQEATKRGLSVQRFSQTCAEEVHSFGKEKVKKFNEKAANPEQATPRAPREYIGFVTGLCSLFRKAKSPTSGQRLFAVFSTSLKETPSHADIFVVIKPDKQERAAIQFTFREAFNLNNLYTP